MTFFRLHQLLKDNCFFLELKHFRALQVLLPRTPWPDDTLCGSASLSMSSFPGISAENPIFSTARLIHSSWLLKERSNQKNPACCSCLKLISPFSRNCCLWWGLRIPCCWLLGAQNNSYWFYYSSLIRFATIFHLTPSIFNKRLQNRHIQMDDFSFVSLKC